ncbi:MAG: TetR/AcrR family transcriptional regulator C-terminal domain-containing protein [Christensenella sp.]|uniref:TetR/AcrR family transcriptional regulator C-terminal domain-containing protein n=1 Tax=Christensenella sp. TaxID=1935934 RepID=UPI002B21B867|nr:TetR/AcrR family transcriptional regulator C-terminal domain-containing protein [Christensenella sp.]MEA5002514.1 TetR/AcrR family transcriptional regulator C-terminal domain-containing protein [Christensenella sp.]
MAINVKRLLANALIELDKEKPLRKITITDIVTRAGTGRQTFYNHFQDKNDLIYWIYLRTLAGEAKLVNTKGYYAYLVNLHQEAQKISDFLKDACKLDGQNSLSDALYSQNYRYYRNFIKTHHGEEFLTEEVEYALHFNAAGGSSTFMQWLLNGAPGTPERQAELTLGCMPQCIKDFIPLYPEDTEED